MSKLIDQLKPSLKLAYECQNSNWDIYANDSGYLYAIAKVGTGAESTHYGDKHHVKRLISQGFLDVGDLNFTEYGLTLFAGIHSYMHTDFHGKKFHVVSF